jgi:hypothetical protein
MADAVLSRVDHLVYGTPDLEAAVGALERTLGIRATPGGRHLGEGTRNALIALGPRSYLEILGPDPESPAPDRPRWLGVDGLDSPRLVAWAAVATDLDQLVEAAGRVGVPVGEIRTGSRSRPDGSALTWRLTDPRGIPAGGVVPFFIDWGDSPHPAASASAGAKLIGLRAEHPRPETVAGPLSTLGLDLAVERGAVPALVAVLEGPRGRIELC